MSYLQENCKITAKHSPCGKIYDLTLACPEMANQARPGQFLHIKVPGKLLRRPISISQIDRENESLRILFEVRGEGTELLSQFAEGGSLDLLGPLGNGFTLLSPEKRAIVVGGGIGIPPMLGVAEHFGKNATALLGFRSQEAAFLVQDFKSVGSQVRIASDNGTIGHHGFVTDLLKEELTREKPDILYACGPLPMLKIVADLAREYEVRCQISMEERMACGVGACLGCACRIRKKDGEETYQHVCKDGPVFEAEEVVF